MSKITNNFILSTIAITALSGCASTQLNYNTADIALSIHDIYIKQFLTNMSSFIDNKNTIPSLVDIQFGTAQTLYSVTPSITYPLSSMYAIGVASVANAIGTLTGTTTTRTTTTAGASMGISASDSWTQNYNFQPIKDANTLRNIRALYRYVIYGDKVVDIFSEYHVFGDAYKMPPHCVTCKDESKEYAPEKLKLNDKLQFGWLYWTNDKGQHGENLCFTDKKPETDHSDSELNDENQCFNSKKPVTDHPERMPCKIPCSTEELKKIHSIGHYGSHELFISHKAYTDGYLEEFLLFLLPNQVAQKIPDTKPTVNIYENYNGKGHTVAPKPQVESLGGNKTPEVFNLIPDSRNSGGFTRPLGVIQ